MLPTGRDFFMAFMGTLMAGGVAVPIYPPVRPAGLEEHLRRQAAILGNALAALLVTVPEAHLVGAAAAGPGPVAADGVPPDGAAGR